jgi:adenosylhomocysteine nucleosidase
MSLLIHFAVMPEAAATLQGLKAIEVHPGSLYKFDGGHIVISGLGNFAAACAIAHYGAEATEIWNFGCAGSLRETLKVGDIFEVSSVMHNPMLPEGIDHHSRKLYEAVHPPIVLAKDGLRLVSSEYPIHLPSFGAKLVLHADLVDMEGYGVARAAQRLGIPCRQWKVVSDFCNLNGPELIQKHLALTSDVIHHKISALI